MLGAVGFSDTLNSGRLVGLARSSFSKKRMRRQKPPLAWSWSRGLSGSLWTSMGTMWIGCVPAFLLCVYLRARYSDGQGLKGSMIDEPECFMGPLLVTFRGLFPARRPVIHWKGRQPCCFWSGPSAGSPPCRGLSPGSAFVRTCAYLKARTFPSSRGCMVTCAAVCHCGCRVASWDFDSRGFF